MKTATKLILSVLSLSALCLLPATAENLEPALQAKVDAKLKEIQDWAADPAIVKAVKAHNDALTPEQSAMNQDKWKGLSILDPFVRDFTKNDAGTLLKNKRGDVVTEGFLSGADGTKVAFLAKPTSWSHRGKEKHDVPMTGKTWQGPVETDESSGQRQLQVAVPVLDAGKPIGSLVIGLGIAKLQ